MIFYENHFPFKPYQSLSKDNPESNTFPIYDDPTSIDQSYISTDTSYPPDNNTSSPSSHLLYENISFPLNPTSRSSPFSPNTTPLNLSDNYVHNSVANINTCRAHITGSSVPTSPYLSTCSNQLLIPNEHSHNPALSPTLPSSELDPCHASLPEIPTSNPPLRHSCQDSHHPKYLADYHCFNIANTNVVNPHSSILSYEKCSPSYKNFVIPYHMSLSLKTSIDPLNMIARKRPWRLGDLLLKKTKLGLWLIYLQVKIPYDADGSIKSNTKQMVL